MQHQMDRDAIREHLSKVLDPGAYNRLVESVPDTRLRGRLRFWQEELLGRAARPGMPTWSAGEFIRVFDGASLLPVQAEPWTREVFLSEIQKWPHGGFPLDETPAEWMAAAWEIDRVRTELSGEMARTVSKCGKLSYTGEYLGFLSRSLPVHRQVELYLRIRDSGNALREGEFRPGFERAFPDCVPFLPPPLTHQQVLAELGITEEEFQQRFARPIQPRASEDDPGPGAKEEIPF